MTSAYNPDEKLIKRPQDDEDLTPDQVEEWIKCSRDKFYFFENYVWCQTPSGRKKFKARPYQERLLNATDEHRFVCCLSSRQSGKSQGVVADILWEIIFKEDYQVLIGSYSNKAVLDFMNRLAFAYQELEWWIKPPAVVFNKFSIRLSNSSSVSGQTFSETFGRGSSTNRILLDELSFADKALADEMMASLIPSISADGVNANTKLNVISTPNGTQGQFYEIWSGALTGDNAFYPVEVKYEEVPNRGPDENGVDHFKEQMMKTPGMTDAKWRQEFLCHFISSSGTLVNSTKIESLESTLPKKEVGDLRLFVDDLKGRKIAMSMDISEGIGEDYHCIQVFDILSLEQIGEYRNNMANQSQLMRHLLMFTKFFFKSGVEEIFFGHECNGVGAGITVQLENMTNDEFFSRVQIISDESRMTKGKTGLVTTNKSKTEACGIFKDLIEMDKMKIHSQRLINELKTFVKKGASFAAQPGNHDDLVSGCLLFVRMLEQLKNYEEGIEDTMSSIGMEEAEECFDIYF